MLVMTISLQLLALTFCLPFLTSISLCKRVLLHRPLEDLFIAGFGNNFELVSGSQYSRSGIEQKYDSHTRMYVVNCTILIRTSSVNGQVMTYGKHVRAMVSIQLRFLTYANPYY